MVGSGRRSTSTSHASRKKPHARPGGGRSSGRPPGRRQGAGSTPAAASWMTSISSSASPRGSARVTIGVAKQSQQRLHLLRCIAGEASRSRPSLFRTGQPIRGPPPVRAVVGDPPTPRSGADSSACTRRVTRSSKLFSRRESRREIGGQPTARSDRCRSSASLADLLVRARGDPTGRAVQKFPPNRRPPRSRPASRPRTDRRASANRVLPVPVRTYSSSSGEPIRTQLSTRNPPPAAPDRSCRAAKLTAAP